MLNPRVIAIQGLGFSPVFVAVQGLIAALVEEQRANTNVVGGGGRARGGRSTTSAKQSYTEADILRLVEDKYQIIEAKREARVEPEIDHVPDTKEVADAPQDAEPSAPVLLTRPNFATPLAIDLPELATVVTPVDQAAKLAKAQAQTQQKAAQQEAERLEQERIAKEAKAKRDEAAIVMILMEL